MSAIAKTSDDEIRAGARRLLELHGVDGVSMAAVAVEVGVRAPSHYKRFASRAELLRAVTGELLGELQLAMEKAVREGDARGSLERMAARYRAFAKKNPRGYALVFTYDAEADMGARMAAVGPLMGVLTGVLGKERALPAARTLVAYLHGFLTMELQGLFQMGGSVEEAYRFGLATILDGLL